MNGVKLSVLDKIEETEKAICSIYIFNLIIFYENVCS